jgi:hypothetical protein
VEFIGASLEGLGGVPWPNAAKVLARPVIINTLETDKYANFTFLNAPGRILTPHFINRLFPPSP